MQSKSREDTRKTKPGQVSLIFWEINELGELNVSVFGVCLVQSRPLFQTRLDYKNFCLKYLIHVIQDREVKIHKETMKRN